MNTYMTDDQFLRLVAAEVQRARDKFPGANATNAALVEEVGEVSKALMYEPWNCVVNEAVQVAAMCVRLATEGDATMKDFRWGKVHDKGRRYTGAEFVMPSPDDVSK